MPNRKTNRNVSSNIPSKAVEKKKITRLAPYNTKPTYVYCPRYRYRIDTFHQRSSTVNGNNITNRLKLYAVLYTQDVFAHEEMPTPSYE